MKRNQLNEAKFYHDWYYTKWLSEIYCEFALMPDGTIYRSTDDTGQDFVLYYKK